MSISLNFRHIKFITKEINKELKRISSDFISSNPNLKVINDEISENELIDNIIEKFHSIKENNNLSNNSECENMRSCLDNSWPNVFESSYSLINNYYNSCDQISDDNTEKYFADDSNNLVREKSMKNRQCLKPNVFESSYSTISNHYNSNDQISDDKTENYYADDSNNLVREKSMKNRYFFNKELSVSSKDQNETTSGIHSEISRGYDECNSNSSTSQNIIPLLGDTTDSYSYTSEYELNRNPNFDKHYTGNLQYFKIAYGTQSEEDTNSCEPEGYRERKSFSWMKKTKNRRSCICCITTSNESIDKSHYFQGCSSPNPYSWDLDKQCQSTPLHRSAKDTQSSFSRILCDDCIKKSTKQLLCDECIKKRTKQLHQKMNKTES